jgi:hypothetical protein
MTVVGLAILAPAVAVAGTLDQEQASVAGGSDNVVGTSALAQTFTAGISGGLDQVSLYLYKTGSPTADINIEIRDGSGSGPGSNILAGRSLPPSSILTTGAFVPVSLAAPVAVVAGTQYAIVVWSSTGNATPYNWGLAATDVYPRGGVFGTSSGPWMSNGSLDYAFRTYVVPTPTPGPTGQRAAALAKCKKKHSHKARKKCKKKANLLPV